MIHMLGKNQSAADVRVPAAPACWTIPELLRTRAELGAKTFLACNNEALSYREAERRSRQVAKVLAAMGARKGTRIGLIYPSDVDFAVCFLAITRLGAVAIPFSTLSTADELRWLLADSCAEILLATRSYRSRNFEEMLKTSIPEWDYSQQAPLHSPSVANLRHIVIDLSTTDPRLASMPGPLPVTTQISDGFWSAIEQEVTPADPLVVVYTSGSTSTPKGVLHRHGTLLEHLSHLMRISAFGPDDALFSNAPFFWIGGLAYNLLGALEAGGRLIYSNSPSAADTLDLIERERPTMVVGFPQSVAHLPSDPSYPTRDFSSIHRGNMPLIMAPDARPKDLELRHNKLGSTETGSVYLTDPDEGDLPEILRGSFGKPTPGFEVKLMDPETGEEVMHDVQGEIWVRGPYMMDGYIGKERFETFLRDGWYRSGDYATRNGEGYFFFKGRLGDMIKTSGANVSPREVEDVIKAVTGCQAYVVGLQDARRGQLVAAAVVTADDHPLDEPSLRERLKEKLSSYKVPRRFMFLTKPQVPTQPTGKLDRRRLIEMFRAT
jgi:acyl-CoA synthetase (AMP-forming)/AMP-acid ligase II